MSFDNGEKKVLTGVYTYQMLLRTFDYDTNNSIFQTLSCFINELLDCENFMEIYTFKEMAQAIYEKEKVDGIKDKVKDFILNLSRMWKGNYFPTWMNVIFNYSISDDLFYTNSKQVKLSSNCSVNNEGSCGKSFLRNRVSANHALMKVNGYVMVELTDESQEIAIRENKGFCTFLEGGVCEVIGIENLPQIPNYKNDWSKISTTEAAQTPIIQ